MTDSCVVFLAKRVFELEKENSLLRVKLSTTQLDFPLATQEARERMKLLLTQREAALEREKRKYEAQQKSNVENKMNSTPPEVEKSTVKTSTVENKSSTQTRYLSDLETCDCNYCFDEIDE